MEEGDTEDQDEEQDVKASETELSKVFLGEISEEELSYEGSNLHDFEKAEGLINVEEGVITEQHIKEIIRELGLIKLCWSEVPKVDYNERLHYPSSYKENSRKEKVLLWYAENFRQQYHHTYPNRRPLMIARNNECDIQKMVCTTVRPTNMKYPEFRTWQGCASFVADHLHYEELENPVVLPYRLSSPQTVLKRQAGHTYEFSTVLVSFLNGSGYDAYVVSGYATREICQKDQTRIECPFLQDEPEEEKEEDIIEDEKYFLKKPTELKSQFLEEMEARELQKQMDAKRAQELAELEAIKEFEKPPPDEFWGWRLHSWVLVLPSKDVTEPFFIEPTTGLGKATDDPEYHGIESIWNHQNYWVLVQFFDKTETCKDISFELNNSDCWERLLVAEPITFRQMPKEIMEAENDEYLTKCTEAEKHLDMPQSWVESLTLSHAEYESRFPNARKTVHYRKAMLEQFSPYSQPDGLEERVTRYDDYKCLRPRLVREKYVHRQDRMYFCEKNIPDNSILEKFHRGREDAVKEHFYYLLDTGLDANYISFYHEARLDGMSKFVMHPSFADIYFENRLDFLYHMHLDFQKTTNVNQAYKIIQKIIVRFLRDRKKEAEENKAEIEYSISEKKVLIKFHYGDENLTQSNRTFLKPAFAEKEARISFDPTLTFGYQTSPVKPPLKPLYLYRLQVESFCDEELKLKLARDKKEEVFVILRLRAQELAAPRLIVTEFDIERNAEARQAFRDREQEKREMEERDMSLVCDFLAPYYVKLGIKSKTPVGKKIAQHMVDECLQDWKNLLVARANDIQQQFEDACQEFQVKNNWYEQNQKTITKEEEEGYFEYCKINSYYLHLLEIRLNRHKELAPTRYLAIYHYLKNDPRLASIFGRHSKHHKEKNV